MTHVLEHQCAPFLIIEADPAAADRLRAVLAHHSMPTVLIRGAGETALVADQAHPLVELAQANDSAALIDNDPHLARSLGADGCHLRMTRDIARRYEEAREIIASPGIVGVEVGKSRHLAMTLAEAGADYIAFGAAPTLQDQTKARTTRNALVEWWAELFEVPCVALDIRSIDEARQVAALGADFVSCDSAGGSTPAAAAADAAALLSALAAAATTGSERADPAIAEQS